MIDEDVVPALAAGTITMRMAVEAIWAEKPKRGRPKGSKNRGVCKHCGLRARPDGFDPSKAKHAECHCDEPLNINSALDKAVDALAMRRQSMSQQEVAESEWRVHRIMTKKDWNVYDVANQRATVAAGALWEEIRVVVAYKRSEYRPGLGRRAGRGYSYKVEPDPVVQASADDRPEEKNVALWGTDVTDAIVSDVQSDLGYEPLERRPSGRRKLEPVELTQEFIFTRENGKVVKWIGSGSGENCRTMQNANPSRFAPPATIAEHWKHAITTETLPSDLPVSEQVVERAEYKPIVQRRLMLKRVTAGWFGDSMLVPINWASVSGELLFPAAVIPGGGCQPDPRCDDDPVQRKWRPLPNPPPMPETYTRVFEVEYETAPGRRSGITYEVETERVVREPRDPAVWPEAQEAIALSKWRADGSHLPIINPPDGRVDFLTPVKPLVKESRYRFCLLCALSWWNRRFQLWDKLLQPANSVHSLPILS